MDARSVEISSQSEPKVGALVMLIAVLLFSSVFLIVGCLEFSGAKDAHDLAFLVAYVVISAAAAVSSLTALLYATLGSENWIISKDDVRFTRKIGYWTPRHVVLPINAVESLGVQTTTARRKGGTYVYRRFVATSTSRKKIAGWGRFSEEDCATANEALRQWKLTREVEYQVPTV
ncbi:MAG: hypothetical protein ABI411_21375 [Tahibacter sp.]